MELKLEDLVGKKIAITVRPDGTNNALEVIGELLLDNLYENGTNTEILGKKALNFLTKLLDPTIKAAEVDSLFENISQMNVAIARACLARVDQNLVFKQENRYTREAGNFTMHRLVQTIERIKNLHGAYKEKYGHPST